MSLFEYYLLFCITTSITAIYEIFWPAISAARKDGIKNEITEYPILSTIIFLVLNIIIAPALFLVIIVPSLHASAVAGINKSVREPVSKI